MPKMSVMGYEMSINKTPGRSDKIREGIDLLKKYKAAKENLESKVIENERWYKMQHWEMIRNKKKDGEPEPTTGYLFNTIANKHADAMDNYPEPNMLPREESDEQEAQSLSDIVPVVIERNNFKLTYDLAWWYKLKQGTGVYGVFWNPDLENGLGDIEIQKLDLLNVYWEPGCTNIQKSRNLFVVSLIDNDILKESYKDKLPESFDESKIVDVKQYTFDDSIDTTGKSLVVDWYYRIRVGTKTVLHLRKFVDEYELASTEDDPNYAQDGLYEHGMYPIEFDVLFPEEGMPTGFGYVDVVKNPQMYIDKLDQIISRNSLQAGKQRFLIKENGNVNEQELLDYGTDVVHSKGGISEEDFRIIQANPLHPFIVQHRQIKIEELKEVSGSNDFSRGESGKGVTAASAIMALQEAGNKLSRDMIQRSYTSFTSITYMIIELISQFYADDRKFRITGGNGKNQYVSYNNAGLQQQQLPTMYPGEEPKFRKPIFDIVVKPERQNPFSKLAHNELAKELYGAGFFNPQMAVQSLVALEMMQFEGKETIVKKIQENDIMMQQFQQAQMIMQQQQAQIIKLAAALQKVTGEDLGMGDIANSAGGEGGMPSGGNNIPQG